jgi:putative DNA primase/helicase
MNKPLDIALLATACDNLEANLGLSSFLGVSGVTGVQPNEFAGVDGNDGVTPAQIGVTETADNCQLPNESERPCFRVFDKTFQIGAKWYPAGVWYFKDETQTRICAPLHVEATTCDSGQDNFGRLLRFKNSLGQWRSWAMPMALLSSSGDELRGILLAMGLEIAYTSKDRALFAAYLQGTPPSKRVQCVLKVGWADRGAFVLPDTVLGPNSTKYIYQGSSVGDEFTTGGTLSEWQSGIADKAVRNPLLMVALSAAFSGPLLERLRAESGGIHFIGDSSTGKTTLVEAACSVYGGANYKRSWRATSNGMEGCAATFNDSLLVLDEISECDPRDVGAIVYALGNGKGKQRANQKGGARSVTQWRCSVLSSGERSVSTSMLEGGKQAKAGQAVRLLDVQASRAFGAWDELHGANDGASFSDAIKGIASTHYGHAGRAFIKSLASDGRDFHKLLERFKVLEGFVSEDGQEKRAAARLAVIALAGELAIEYRLVSWEGCEATNAAILAFDTWRTMRGAGNDEPKKILQAVADFIARHGDSRFSHVDRNEETPVHNRAGWFRDRDMGREYLFSSTGMKDALTGFDLKRALEALQVQGAIVAGSDGKRSQPIRAAGTLQRLYVVKLPAGEA